MLYRVIIPKKAQKDLKKIDQRYKQRILAALTSLSMDPFVGKKLEGEHKDRWSYQVWPYRILYEINKNELVVLIVRVGHRQGVY